MTATTTFNRSMVQNKVSMVTEMDLSWRDFGLFARGRAYYDDVYDQETDHERGGLPHLQQQQTSRTATPTSGVSRRIPSMSIAIVSKCWTTSCTPAAS